MRIAIIGAGFTGCLLAVQLLRRSAGAAKVVLIERGGPPGRGMAYGTP
ncbi:FAD-dependent oxidoreductase, partial [Inquilinus sp.]